MSMNCSDSKMPPRRVCRAMAMAVLACLMWLPSTASSLALAQASLPSKSSLPSKDASASANDASPSGNIESEIALWIEKLGDPVYARRLQAQSELERIGVRALDQLHAASFHPDPQIASQARFLVQSNQFSWAWETDPFHVRRILGNYTTAPLYEKSAFIDQLAALDNQEGLSALCRLVRYETQGCLAKRAALLLMRSKPSPPAAAAERRELILNLVNGTMSAAGKWVTDYAAAHGEFPADLWEERIQAEKALLANKSPETSTEILSDLRKWVVEQISKTPANRERALRLARTVPETFSALGANRNQQALEFAQWAIAAELHELVQEQHDQLSRLTLLDPRFGYLLAESHDAQGSEEVAKQIAKHSADRLLVDSHGKHREEDPITDQKQIPLNQRLEETLQRNVSQAFERSAMGEFLINRGKFAWAEHELRLAIQGREDDVEFATILNLTQLSQLLHEQDRNQEAAEVLEKFAQRFEREPLFQSQVSEQGGSSLVSNYYLYSGNHAATHQDTEQARKHYLKSIELASDNVDAIIGLYRLPNPTQEHQQERLQLQQQISGELRNEIDARQRDLRRENPRFQATEERSLANQMNTLAWLIANTEGNFEEALFLSRKACSLAPDRAAYLDTLAHCYAALDRYSEAVDQQRRAIALEPHQPTLLKALRRFESKLSEPKESP
jgi:hypothetical protein